MRNPAVGVVLLSCLAWNTGCAGERDKARPAIALSPVDCGELHADGRCDVAGSLTVLVPSASGKLEAVSWHTAEGERPIETASRATIAGTLLSVTTEGPGTLRVDTERGTARLVLGTVETPGELAEARALRAEGKLDAAEARLSTLLEHRDPALRARARGLLARIHLSAGRVDEAVREFRASIALAEHVGLRATAAKDRIALGDTLRQRKFALDDARAVLRGVDAADLEGAAWAGHQLSLVDQVSGNARAALVSLAAVEERARGLGFDDLVTVSAYDRAHILSALGRHAEALAVFPAIRKQVADDPCSRALYLVNLGWNQLLAAMHHAGPLDVSASQEAAQLYDTKCPKRWSRDNALINVAMGKALGGAHEQALALLEQSRDGAAPGFVVEAFQRELEAQLHSDAGRHAEALAIYERMTERSGEAAPIAFRYRVALGRALALRALDRPRDAIAALREAEAALEQQERLVPLGDERGSFLGFHQEAGAELVDLLLELGRPAEALAVVRSGRSRLLRSLARWGRISLLDGPAQARWESALGAFRAAREQADAHAERAWTVPEAERAAYLTEGEALAAHVARALDAAFAQIGEHATVPDAPEPRAGEALLTAHPVRGGWAAFLLLDGKVEVARFTTLELADPNALSAALLTPFAATLRRARTLRVLSGGTLDKVAVHALPFGDAPLLATLPVVYALDLPGAPPAAGSLTKGDVALLVVDPRRDLPLAAEEAKLASAALASRGRLVALEGRDATLTALLARLPDARWFHFAGHAELSRRGMLESSLSLASGSTLPLSDVLALPRVPEVVVLSACEGALAFQLSETGAFASLGLAQAFVLGGTRAVLATTAAVPDRVAQAMSSALYAAPFEGRLGPDEFRRSALALRTQFPEQWWYFRLLVP